MIQTENDVHLLVSTITTDQTSLIPVDSCTVYQYDHLKLLGNVTKKKLVYLAKC